MKEIYNEFFYIPKRGKGKVREKVMLAQITLSVVLILACMAAMCLTAYAYFSHVITANVAVIRSATWDIVATAEPDVVLNNEFYLLDNSGNDQERIFEFVIEKDTEAATATVGYVRIDVRTDIDNYSSLQTYYSQPIGEFLLNGEMTTDMDRIVQIVVPAGRVAQVKFTGEWGTCAKEPIIEEGEEIKPVFLAASSVPADTTTTTDNSTEGTTEAPQTQTNSTEQNTTDATTSSSESTTDTTDTTASTQAETDQATETAEVSSTPTTEEAEGIKPVFSAASSLPANTTTTTDNSTENTTEATQTQTNSTEQNTTDATTSSSESTTGTTDTTAPTQSEAEIESFTPSTEASSAPTTEEAE